MKVIKKLLGKLIEKIKENPQASMRFGIFLVILCLAYAYPLASAIVCALACMIAIDQRSKARESLSFLKVPADIAKIVASETKEAVDTQKAKMAAGKAAKAEAKAEAKPEEKTEVK